MATVSLRNRSWSARTGGARQLPQYWILRKRLLYGPAWGAIFGLRDRARAERDGALHAR